MDIIVGIIAIAIAARQTIISISTDAADTARAPVPLPIETNEQIGRISVRSIMFAPRMLPTESEPAFLRIAVIVVTSSGRDVPIAIAITLIILCGTLRLSAIFVP